MSWLVAIHRFWPNGTETTSALKHVGPFPTEAEAREYADGLERPMIGYAYPLSEVVERTWPTNDEVRAEGRDPDTGLMRDEPEPFDVREYDVTPDGRLELKGES